MSTLIQRLRLTTFKQVLDILKIFQNFKIIFFCLFFKDNLI